MGDDRFVNSKSRIIMLRSQGGAMRFRDRREAGRQLAGRLGAYRGDQVLVLGLPRGGVEVAYEVARALNAPLDVVVARKIGAPFQPELGVGAIAEDGPPVFDERALQALQLSFEDLAPLIARERAELRRRVQRYRQGRAAPQVPDRTVLLVDDGLATGVTARAALRSLARRQPHRLVLAAPVCAPETVRQLREDADDVVCVVRPERFAAVGLWYEDFRQTSDETVLELLKRARKPAA
jgi:putative phosphoribosyl transferase